MVVEVGENSFDDTPVIATNKPFYSLLEDHLSKCQNDPKSVTELSNQQQTRPKFSYLRKGHGLRRYYKDPIKLLRPVYAPIITGKKLQGQSDSNFGLPQRSLKLKPFPQKHEPCGKTHGLKNSTLLDDPAADLLRKFSSECKDNRDVHPVIPENDCKWRDVLEENKSVYQLPERSAQPELSYEDMSDGNRTLQQENQELLAFELLEQHAANSSFSSSSSFVAALMERAFGSTPKKHDPPDLISRVDPLRGNSDVHKMYAENYRKYISAHSKSEGVAVREGTDNNKFNTGIGLANKVVNDVTSEEKSLHVHFADEDGNEDSVPDISQIEENRSEKMDFKDESTWSNCSCSTCCSVDSQIDKLQDTTCHDSSTIDYSKYPSMSVKTLKGILSPTKKSSNTSRILHSATVDKPAESKGSTKNSVSNVMTQTDNTETIFKSELLISRLQDLEHELDILQKAKIELTKMKKEHEDNVRKFTKEKKMQEKKIKEEEERVKSMLEEERWKLGKERLVLQKYSKSLKNFPTKEEREVIQALKQQVAELQDEMHKKESRWTAFQVRSRDRTKSLEQENAKLKQEINDLKEQRQKQMKVYETNRSRVKNPTRIMNLINKQIGLLTTMNLNKAVTNENSKQLLKYQDKKPACTESSSGEKQSSGKKSDAGKKPTSNEKSSGAVFTETIFPNGDIEQKFENGRVKFYYASTKTFQTTEVNGTEVYEFPNGQTEYHYTDGSKKVTFVDGSIKLIYTTGQEEWVLPDNTHWTVGNHGEKVVTLPNGDKEISTENYLRREYSNGTVRILFPDGRLETRYPNGRLRVKNAEGQLILDLMETK